MACRPDRARALIRTAGRHRRRHHRCVGRRLCIWLARHSRVRADRISGHGHGWGHRAALARAVLEKLGDHIVTDRLPIS